MIRRVQIIDFIVDTGAMFTCCNYTAFDKNLNEKDFMDNDVKLLGGFVKGAPVKFYFCKDSDDYNNNFKLLTA